MTEKIVKVGGVRLQKGVRSLFNAVSEMFTFYILISLRKLVIA